MLGRWDGADSGVGREGETVSQHGGDGAPPWPMAHGPSAIGHGPWRALMRRGKGMQMVGAIQSGNGTAGAEREGCGMWDVGRVDMFAIGGC